jgi:hypothetical protein
MQLVEMIGRFRVSARDKVEPYLWCDEVIRARLHEGQREVAIRQRLIRDSDCSQCTIPFYVNQRFGALHPSIINIDYADLWINGVFDSNLTITDRGTLSKLDPEWRSLTGTPEYIVNDDANIMVSPLPDVECEVRIDAVRYPFGPDTVEMEVSSEHHEAIVDYALAISYDDTDSDAYDARRADKYMRSFERKYGPPVAGGARRRAVASAPHRNTVQL